MKANLETGVFSEIVAGKPVLARATAQLVLTVIGDNRELADLAARATAFQAVPVVLTIVPEDTGAWNRKIGEQKLPEGG